MKSVCDFKETLEKSSTLCVSSPWTPPRQTGCPDGRSPPPEDKLLERRDCRHPLHWSEPAPVTVSAILKVSSNLLVSSATYHRLFPYFFL